MAEAKTSWWDIIFNPQKAVLTATLEAMKTAQAFVDPSRLFLGWGLTAFNPSLLVTRKGLAVYDEMKRDEQVKRCLAFKKAAILASGWEVISPADEDEGWEVTAFVRDTFTHFPGGWRRALKKMLLKMDYGYSVTEKIYGEAVWAPGRMVLQKLTSIKPHYIDFQVNPQGVLLAVIQRTAVGANLESLFPPGKFVIFTHDEEFENPYGKADLEATYRAWWVKDNAYKWFAMYLERYGMAPLFALYNPNVYQGADSGKLRTMLKNIQSATTGIIPRASEGDLELWSQEVSASSKEIFLAALGRFDADIASSLLVPSLIGAGSDGGAQGDASKGSYARAKTHFDTFMMVISEEQGYLADDAINSQVIPQLCDMNFPGLTSYPKLRCLPFDDEQKLELYKLWSELVTGKVVNQIEDDEIHIRKALGFPENENPTLPDPAEVGVDQGKPVAVKNQTEEMRVFAEEHDGIWIEYGDETVCVDRFAWEDVA